MLNWICIIALAAAFFIGRPAAQQETESRPKPDSLNESFEPSDWEMDNPLMILFRTEFLPGTITDDIQMEGDTSSEKLKKVSR